MTDMVWDCAHNRAHPYVTWIGKWTSNLAELPNTVIIPPGAAVVTTPLHTDKWQAVLTRHPNRPLVNFFISGITQDFRIGFSQLPNMLKSARKNLCCASQHPEVVEEYLPAEVAQHRVAGLFTKSMVPRVHVSRFAVIPKSHTLNKWRLIVDLFHPSGHSVNDGIPKDLCGLTYITVDTAIELILKNWS